MTVGGAGWYRATQKGETGQQYHVGWLEMVSMYGQGCAPLPVASSNRRLAGLHGGLAGVDRRKIWAEIAIFVTGFTGRAANTQSKTTHVIKGLTQVGQLEEGWRGPSSIAKVVHV